MTALSLLPALFLLQSADLPDLDVTLAPVGTEEAGLTRINVEMVLEQPGFAVGTPILRMPTFIVATPTAAYETADLTVSDDLGELTLTQHEEAPNSTGRYRHWTADRDTVGDVRYAYGTPPREVSAATRNGPLFDLRAEEGGLQGAGVYFFAVPKENEPHEISLSWDMSQAPEGTRGVTSHGEGDQSRIAPPTTLAFSYYSMGPVKSIPEEGKSAFALYWLSEPPFDMVTFGIQTKKLYDFMADFFGDEDSTYKVFARKNPYPSGGGTVLANSFMFGYGSEGDTVEGGKEGLIAHEMAHNWPRLDSDPHPFTAWYTEGTAEYYSTVLPYRARMTDAQSVLESINAKAERYYTNPFADASNAAAGDVFWIDSRAQRVPYGRGFLYLAALDAKLKESSGGETSVDTLVLEVLARQRQGGTVDLAAWEELVVSYLGDEGAEMYRSMTKGEPIDIPTSTFGPCFEAYETEVRGFDLGFDDMRLAVVADLRDGSPAATVGLREGESIIRIDGLDEAREDASQEVIVRVVRDGVQQDVQFLPRGEPKPATLWRWAPGFDAQSDCAL